MGYLNPVVMGGAQFPYAHFAVPSQTGVEKVSVYTRPMRTRRGSRCKACSNADASVGNLTGESNNPSKIKRLNGSIWRALRSHSAVSVSAG